MTFPTAALALVWLGAAFLFAGATGASRRRLLLAAGTASTLVGAVLVVRASSGWIAGLSEAIAHVTAALTLLAVAVPLASSRGARKTEPNRTARREGVGVAASASRYGAGRLWASLLGAPAAGLLVALVLPRLVPATQDVRYLAAVIAVVPLSAAAPWLALRASSGRHAWTASVVTIVAALGIYWGIRR